MSLLCELVVGGPDMALVCVPAQRQYGRMLQQQELIRDLVVTPLRDELMLHVPRIAIRDLSQPFDLEWSPRPPRSDDTSHRTAFP